MVDLKASFSSFKSSAKTYIEYVNSHDLEVSHQFARMCVKCFALLEFAGSGPEDELLEFSDRVEKRLDGIFNVASLAHL